MFDWTTYSKLTCLQINVDIILFCDRQFDSFFNTTHTVIGVTTKMHNSLTHRSQSPSNPQKEFLPKILKWRDLFASRKFTLLTQHDSTNSPKEKKLWRVSGGGGTGGREPGRIGGGMGTGSGREILHANYFNSTMRYKTFKIKKPKYIWLAFNVFSVTSETSEQTSKRKFALGLKNRLTSGEMVNLFTVVTS